MREKGLKYHAGKIFNDDLNVLMEAFGIFERSLKIDNFKV